MADTGKAPPDFILPLTANAPAGQNGRVAFGASDFSDRNAGLPGFSTQTGVEADFQTDMLRGNWESTPVSSSFFSVENIKRLQQFIRKGVYDRSQPKGYIIDDQSTDELKIIMRAIYYQYARNMPKDVKAQVEDLNRKVVDWSVPHILSAVDHYHFYLNDISHMPVPLAQPQHLSRAGTKSLPMNPFM
jgi:glycerophosphoryl diester phosphodiesterase